jgi:signal transduction histidine kinase
MLVARLSLSLGEEYRTLARTRQLFLAYFLLDSFLLLGVGLYCSRRFIVGPLQRLLSATRRVASGHFDHRLEPEGSTELAALADSFNRMQGALKAKEEELAANYATLVKAHDELKEARQETLRSERLASVGLLAAGMGHEIGTPLAAIMGYGSMLRDELAADPLRADFAARIVADAERIDRIVRGLLAFARPEPGNRERIDLPQLLESLRELLETQGFCRTIALAVDLDRAVPTVVADRSMLQQVLMNLCLNARDAMPAGGELFIRLRRGWDDRGRGAVRLEVEDTGTGIEAEHLLRIFDPFFTTKEPGKGTGLGLAISARIVESFGGTISAASRPEVGTLFTICLPAAADSGEGP